MIAAIAPSITKNSVVLNARRVSEGRSTRMFLAVVYAESVRLDALPSTCVCAMAPACPPARRTTQGSCRKSRSASAQQVDQLLATGRGELRRCLAQVTFEPLADLRPGVHLLRQREA